MSYDYTHNHDISLSISISISITIPIPIPMNMIITVALALDLDLVLTLTPTPVVEHPLASLRSTEHPASPVEHAPSPLGPRWVLEGLPSGLNPDPNPYHVGPWVHGSMGPWASLRPEP